MKRLIRLFGTVRARRGHTGVKKVAASFLVCIQSSCLTPVNEFDTAPVGFRRSAGLARRCVEVRRLVGDPTQKAGHFWVGVQRDRRFCISFQIQIREACMDRSMADRMDRNCVPSAAALRQRMMPFNPAAERSGAEPAGFSFGCGGRQRLHPASGFSMLARYCSVPSCRC